MRKQTLHRGGQRAGKTLVLFVLLTPVLLGMIGLAIDGGLIMAAQRQAQNAADAAATAAAMDLMRGASNSTAQATAQTFLNSNGFSGTTLALNSGSTNVLNIPPTAGPYNGTNHYAEVVLSKSISTLFIQVLGVNSSQQVSARAVAGYEPVGAGEGVMVLNYLVSTGINAASNNVQLIVNGDITVNANGQGDDQYGNTVGSGNGGPAIDVSTGARTPPTIIATNITSVGGVRKGTGGGGLDNLRVYDSSFAGLYDPSSTDRPLYAPGSIAPDPLESLVAPTTSTGVVVGPSSTTYWKYQAGSWVSAATPQDLVFNNGDTVTVPPGIYSSLTVRNGALVTLQAGIYVLAGGGLTMNGGTLRDNNAGVMIYNTGSSYNPATGAPDTSGVGNPNYPTAPQGGSVSITGSSTVNISPYSNSSSPFYGIVFYQSRLNISSVTISGNSSNINFWGSTPGTISTLYAKWADFILGGTGTFNAQFLVGTFTLNGGSTVTIQAAGKLNGRNNVVFLVE
jgi:Flp pilus assembly protein TadG